MRGKLNIKVLSLLLVMILALGNVFAKDIKIFPKREYNNGKSDVVFRLYESPHKTTTEEFFRNYQTGDIQELDTSGASGNDDPRKYGYITYNYVLSDKPLSNYTSGASYDRSNYGYLVYDSYVSEVEGISNRITPTQYKNATKVDCKRPITIPNYTQNVIKILPAYGYQTVGAGPKAISLLCSADRPERCSHNHLDHTLASIQGIEHSVFNTVKAACKNRTIKDSTGEYVYISKGLKVDRTLTNQRPAVANTAGEFYDITIPGGKDIGWAYTQKGSSTDAKPLSIINVYDNKLYFPEPLEATIKIRYFDIANKDSNLDKRKTSFITLEKQDKSIFTKEDVDKMLIEEKEIPYTPGDCIEIPEKDGMVILGSNKTTSAPKDYTGKDKIVIGDINSQKICPTDEENSKDVYIDIFYNSKKRIYMRHINVTGKYNEATNEIVGLTPTIVANSERFHKTSDPYANLYKSETNEKIGTANGITPTRGFDEEYNINVKNYIEPLNIVNVKRVYVGSKSAIDYNRTDALNKLNNNYNGTVKFNPSESKDSIQLSAKDDEVTFIDMFYVINPDPNIPPDIPDQVTPPPEIEVVPPSNPGGPGANLKPDGKLYFESREEKFKETTANEFDKELKDDKIPSSEDLYYGPLDVKPYLIGTVKCKDNKVSTYVSNGRNMINIKINYRTFDTLGFFTIKNNVEIYDKKEQTGGQLFDNGTTLKANLSSKYTSMANGAHIEPGKYEINKYTSTRNGGNEYYIDHYVDIYIQNDSLVLGDGTILIPKYEKKYSSKIGSERYVKNKEGNFVYSSSGSSYYSPSSIVVEKENYNGLVNNDVAKIKKVKPIREMKELYEDNKAKIPDERFNGKRILSGKLEYEASPAAVNAGKDSVAPLIMNEENKKSEPVIVLTPVIANMNLKSGDDFVDHTENDVSGQVLQRNTPFEVQMLTTGITHPSYVRVQDYLKYINRHEIQFTFALKYYKTYDKDGNLIQDVSTPVGPLTWIEVPPGGKIYTQAAYGEDGMADESEEGQNQFNTLEGKYHVKVYAINCPKTEEFKQDARLNSKDLSDDRYNIVNKSHKLYHGLTLKNEVKYVARDSRKTVNLGRIYDFKITDVVDIDWKNVFRKDNAIDHTGNFYYSGISRWDIYSKNANAMVLRKDTEIGRNPQRVLPVGPKKHTNLNYAKAPKMGYKFAFDLKTTGRLDNTIDKYIEIKPEYYYISKDGTKFYDSNKIDLYYMTSAKRYVKVGSSADNYKITMRPADGARYISSFESEFNKSNLSKDIISIGNLSKIKLTLDKNLVENEKNLVQLWYGEFKLPNSTIAVLKGNSDLEHPLKDGYIGVKFNITCVEKNDAREIILSYNKNNKNKPGVPNTSQWDYERYMKVTPEQPYDFGYRLEKGVWNITDSVFQKVKGTVMLYDTDLKAADDFEVGAGK